MPCESGPSRIPTEEERRALKKNQDLQKLVKKLERLEPLLCSACRVLERLGADFDENPELSEWWDAHKKKDQARSKREDAKRQKALATEWRAKQVEDLLQKPLKDLTPEDRSILKEAKAL